MKKILFIALIISIVSCTKEVEEETAQKGYVQEFLTEEVQEFIRTYAKISVNHCNGQIDLLFIEEYPEGGSFQWGMNFNQADEVHPCVTWYSNNPNNEPLIIPFVIDPERSIYAQTLID